MKWHVLLGIMAGTLLVAGTFSPAASLLQKALFAIGAPLLGITAYADKQRMFTALQAVATVGAWTALFPALPEAANYAVLAAAAVLAVAYLVRGEYYKADRFGWLGTLGLLCFAAGFATSAASHAVAFELLFITGGTALAVYSLLDFIDYKVRIALIWAVLNALLAINPALSLLKSILTGT